MLDEPKSEDEASLAGQLNENASASHGSRAPTQEEVSQLRENLRLAVAKRPRDGGDSLKGFRYQALVTMRMLLDLQPDQALRIEGAEDIELWDLDGASATPTPSLPIAKARISVKDHKGYSLDWGDNRIHESVMEFLIQFQDDTRPKDCRFVLLTPSELGLTDSSLLGQWRIFSENPAAGPEFIAHLRAKLKAKIDKCDREQLRKLASMALRATNDDELYKFARLVDWAGGYAREDSLEATLAKRLGSLHEATTGFRGEVCVHILADIIMQRATRKNDVAGKTLDASFIAQTLAEQRSDQAAWNAKTLQLAELESQLQSMPRSVANELAPQIKALLEEKDQRDEQRAADLAAQINKVIADSAPRTASGSSSVEPLPFGGAIANAIVEQHLIDLIADAQYPRALALIQERLKVSGGTERAVLLYLQASAWSGINTVHAVDSARESAKMLAETDGWNVLMSGYADLLDWQEGNISAIERVSAASSDVTLQRCVSVLLAEFAFRDDRHDDVLRLLAPLGADRRALKLRLRSLAAQHQFDQAHALLQLFTPSDPETYRLAAFIELHRLIAYSTPSGATSYPADVQTRCIAVRDMLERAITVCPSDAIYRKLDLLANAGVTSLWANDPEGALVRLNKAQRIDPSVPEVHLQSGNALAKMGRHREAADAARQALKFAGAPAKSHIRALSHLLLGRLALENASDSIEAEVALRCNIGMIDGDPRIIHESRLVLTRLLLAIQRHKDAYAELAAWPKDADSGQRQLAEAMIALEGEDNDAALPIINAIEAQPTTDLSVRHEARMYAVIAHFNAKRFRQAADVGLLALDMGCGRGGCDLVLAALRRAPNAEAQCEELENRLLLENPQNVAALASRAFRRESAGLLAEAADAQRRVAETTDTYDDRLKAAKLLWRSCRYTEAADILLPKASEIEGTAHLIFASFLYAARQDWPSAFSIAMKALEGAPNNPEALQNAQHKTWLVMSHSVLTPEQFTRARSLFALPKDAAGIDETLAIVNADNLAAFAQRAKEEQENQRRLLYIYEHIAKESSTLADTLGLPHAQIINLIMHSGNLHFSSRAIRRRQPGATLTEWKDIDQILLDLPSFMVAARTGMIPLLKRRWRVAICHEQAAELTHHYESQRTRLALAQTDGWQHITPNGPQPIDPVPLREEVKILAAMTANFNRGVELTQLRPRVQTAAGTREAGPAQRTENLLFHEVRPKERVVVLERALIDHGVLRIGFTELLNDLRALDVITFHEHTRVVCAVLRHGVRGVGMSMQTLIDTIQYEQGLGPNSRRLIGHLRESNWAIQRVVENFRALLVGYARRDVNIDPYLLSQVIVGTLFGRSFTRENRIATMRHFKKLAREGQRALQGNMSIRLRSALRAVRALHRSGDPGAFDVLMPGRTREHGENTAEGEGLWPIIESTPL